MHGKLVDGDGNTIDACDMYTQHPGVKASMTSAYGAPFCPGDADDPDNFYTVGLGKKQIFDIIPVWALLKAAGIDLDEVSDFHGNDGMESVRYAGLVLVLNIHYEQISEGFSYTVALPSRARAPERAPPAPFSALSPVRGGPRGCRFAAAVPISRRRLRRHPPRAPPCPMSR